MSHSGYLHPDHITSIKIKSGGSFDNQAGDFRWEEDARADHSLPMAKESPYTSVEDFDEPDNCWHEKPLPEVRSMAEEEDEVSKTEHVREVEDLEVPRLPYKG